jgi:hypothetical protein
MTRTVPLLLTAALGACAGSRGTAVQAPVEVTIAPVGNLAHGAAGGTEHGKPGSACSVQLVPGRISKSEPGCYVDEHLSEGSGVLIYPCGGDGVAEATFGPQHYRGEMRHGNVKLELTTELDWEDGCRWGTDAVLEGLVLTGGGLTKKKLVWHYRDRVIRGKDCSGLCTAQTSLQVRALRGDRSVWDADPKADEDEDDDDGG